jgi:hypothetical protein
VLLGKAHIGEHVLLGRVEERCELGQLGPDLVGALAPLRSGGVGMILGEGGGDERRHHAPIAMPRTSRLPSVLTATAIVTATETMRPASRTFTYVASIQR